MSKNKLILVARQWPELYGDFRQGFVSASEARTQLWGASYSFNECCDIVEQWANELTWEDVAAEKRIASRR